MGFTNSPIVKRRRVKKCCFASVNEPLEKCLLFLLLFWSLCLHFSLSLSPSHTHYVFLRYFHVILQVFPLFSSSFLFFHFLCLSLSFLLTLDIDIKLFFLLSAHLRVVVAVLSLHSSLGLTDKQMCHMCNSNWRRDI